ncbi:Uncharacterised protein [Klebsiella pneumoniae]|nr:Uncharacterised protein [Klebsiella pneumoniae]
MIKSRIRIAAKEIVPHSHFTRQTKHYLVIGQGTPSRRYQLRT